MFKLIVAGSRTYEDYEGMRDYLDHTGTLRAKESPYETDSKK